MDTSRATRGVVFGVFLAVAAAAAAAQTPFEPATGAARFRMGWREAVVSTAPPETLRAEPRYRGARPLYVALPLGSGADATITVAVDESGGTGTGYDTLIADAGNDNDLSNDVAVKVAPRARDGARLLDAGPSPMTVRYSDGSARRLAIALSLRVADKGGPGGLDGSASCHVAQHLEGRLDFGERTGVRVAVYDSSIDVDESAKCGDLVWQSNGCFNDFGVDRLRIDTDGNGLLDPDAEDFPLSRIVVLDGRLWDLSLDAGARRVEVRPNHVPTGKLVLRCAYADGGELSAGRIELAGESGLGLAADLKQGATMLVPAGAYRVRGQRLALRDAAHRAWIASFMLPEPVRVPPGGECVVQVGSPLNVVPETEGDAKPGGEVRITPAISGRNGEVYDDLSPAGQRMEPQVTILDAEDIVVSSGSMEYG